ncbi:MAG: hypothetical protein IPK13_21375 [Deltaproteobacteria bacterium]|nr:hypothetical protein [Deltaproteobacteria bacterium]
MAGLELRLSDGLFVELGLDSGLFSASAHGVTLDGRAPAEVVAETLMLGETFIAAQVGEAGALEIRLGKLRPHLGEGAIFSAYGFGLLADLDLTLLDAPKRLPLSFRVQAYLPDGTFSRRLKQSPIIEAEAALHLGRNTEVRLIGALFFDTQDVLAQLLGEAFGRGRLEAFGDQAATIASNFEAEFGPLFADEIDQILLDYVDAATEAYNAGDIGFQVRSSGFLAWTGLSLRWRVQRELSVQLTALASFGTSDLRVSPDEAHRAFILEASTRRLLPALTTAIERRRPDLSNAQIARLASAATDRLAQVIEAETFAGAEGSQRLALNAYFAQGQIQYRPIRAIELSLFGILASGDRGQITQGTSGTESTGGRSYHGFVSLSPFLPYTSIFFNGGIATNSASSTVVSVAPDGAGLAAVGLKAETQVRDLLFASCTIARMHALAPPPDTGKTHYGTEANVTLAFTPIANVQPEVQGALFFPGGYFGDVQRGYQFIVGASADLP